MEDTDNTVAWAVSLIHYSTFKILNSKFKSGSRRFYAASTSSRRFLMMNCWRVGVFFPM